LVVAATAVAVSAVSADVSASISVAVSSVGPAAAIHFLSNFFLAGAMVLFHQDIGLFDVNATPPVSMPYHKWWLPYLLTSIALKAAAWFLFARQIMRTIVTTFFGVMSGVVVALFGFENASTGAYEIERKRFVDFRKRRDDIHNQAVAAYTTNSPNAQQLSIDELNLAADLVDLKEFCDIAAAAQGARNPLYLYGSPFVALLVYACYIFVPIRKLGRGGRADAKPAGPGSPIRSVVDGVLPSSGTSTEPTAPGAGVEATDVTVSIQTDKNSSVSTIFASAATLAFGVVTSALFIFA